MFRLDYLAAIVSGFSFGVIVEIWKFTSSTSLKFGERTRELSGDGLPLLKFVGLKICLGIDVFLVAVSESSASR